MRDEALYLHMIIGLLLVILPVLIVLNSSKKSSYFPYLKLATTALSWLLLIPAGIFYILFYPATKTLILAGQSPWAHEVVMETKEHWGIFLPLIATVALIVSWKEGDEEAKNWWILLAIVSLAIGVLGRVVTMGAGA